jgi:hypothetical protein
VTLTLGVAGESYRVIIARGSQRRRGNHRRGNSCPCEKASIASKRSWHTLDIRKYEIVWFGNLATL